MKRQQGRVGEMVRRSALSPEKLATKLRDPLRATERPVSTGPLFIPLTRRAQMKIAVVVAFWRKGDKNSGAVRALSDEVSRFRGCAGKGRVAMSLSAGADQGFEVSRGGGRAQSPFGSRQPWLRRCLLGKQTWGFQDWGSVGTIRSRLP